MILLYVLFLVVAVAVFFLMPQVGLLLRLGIAVAAFVLPSVGVTWFIHKTGDQAPPDSVTVLPSKVNRD